MNTIPERTLILLTFAVTAVAACGTNTPIGAQSHDGGAGTGAGGTAISSAFAGASGSGAGGTAGTSSFAGTTGGGVGGAAGTSSFAGTTGGGVGGAAGTSSFAGTSGSGAAGTTIAGAGGTTSVAGTSGTTTGAAGMQGPYVPDVPITKGDLPFMNPTTISGVWTGYFENFQFPSGSDAIQLSFGNDASGNQTLRVVLGDPTPIAPATDPTKYWPPSLASKTATGFPIVGEQQLEGFSYPAHEVRWQGLRLTFKLASAEPWTGWCGLQTSYKTAQGYNCIPGSGGGSNGSDQCFTADNGVQTSVSCAQLYMCLGTLCTCNATGCGPGPSHDMPFDITFTATTGMGSARFDDSANGLQNIHVMPN